MGLTGEFISFLSEIDFKELPERVIEQTKYLLLDYLGVALGGSRSESSLPVYRMIQRLSADGLGTVIGQSLKALPGYAALANGTAAHSLELDDTHQAGSLHPGVVVFSAAIAASEAAAHQVDGRRFITAVMAGHGRTAKIPLPPWISSHRDLRGVRGGGDSRETLGAEPRTNTFGVWHRRKHVCWFNGIPG
jgi:2-methylcitrate dehydratase PrpD